MKLGISTYCMVKELRAGTMTLPELLHWAKDHGCKHVELVPYGYTLVDHPELADEVRDLAASLGLILSNYAMPANFCHLLEEDFEAELDRVKRHVDLLDRMGIRSLRHDVTPFTVSTEESAVSHFLKYLPRIVQGSREIADYAARYGIVTNIENHGWVVQHSDRVQQLWQLVDRPNFKTVLDIGNFLCVDEDPLVGVAKNLPYASIIHLKDFYVRSIDEYPGDGEWFLTANGNYLRGSIFGQGDLPVRNIMKRIKSSGYDGFLTLEFEGMEDCRMATHYGLKHIERLWNEL